MRRLFVLAAVVVMVPTAAFAQWFDSFEGYGTGPLASGGWDGWDGTASARGNVTNAFSRTGDQSIEIGGGADAVRQFTGYTSGQWRLTAWMLMDVADHTTNTFFIVMNEYNHGGPYTWTSQLLFDAVTGTVTDTMITGGPAIAIDYGNWAEIRIDYDLVANTQSAFYNGSLLGTGLVARSTGDPLAIATVDLYTTGATSYYDDMSIGVVPEPASLIALGAGALALLRRRRRKTS